METAKLALKETIRVQKLALEEAKRVHEEITREFNDTKLVREDKKMAQCDSLMINLPEDLINHFIKPFVIFQDDNETLREAVDMWCIGNIDIEKGIKRELLDQDIYEDGDEWKEKYDELKGSKWA